MLRNNRTGFHFRRQHRMAGYVLDFYCEPAKLCVELDGTGHAEHRANRDWIRDSGLGKLGILTLRLTNDQVASDLYSCFLLIRNLCEERVERFRPDREVDD